jgi:hypothetical protein
MALGVRASQRTRTSQGVRGNHGSLDVAIHSAYHECQVTRAEQVVAAGALELPAPERNTLW